MIRRSGLLTLIGLGLCVSAPARAAAVCMGDASLDLFIGSLPAISVPWQGFGCTDTTPTSITGLTPNMFQLNGEIPIADPGTSPITGISVSGATTGIGNFAFDSSGNGFGTMSIGGVWTFCVIAPCADPISQQIVVPFDQEPGPAGVGVGGRPILVDSPTRATLVGSTWTTGTVSLEGRTETGSPYLSGAFPGCGSCLFGGVTLVSAALILADAGRAADVPVIGRLHLEWALIPEPGTFCLLGTGLLVLAAARRQTGDHSEATPGIDATGRDPSVGRHIPQEESF